jgi:hypothetical protein
VGLTRSLARELEVTRQRQEAAIRADGRLDGRDHARGLIACSGVGLGQRGNDG